MKRYNHNEKKGHPLSINYALRKGINEAGIMQGKYAINSKGMTSRTAC